MENSKIIVIVFLSLFFFKCREFKGEKLEINYKEGYVKILSNDYVIDSLIVNNHIKQYLIISLSNKSKGNNIIFFRKNNTSYKVYKDSLDYFCSKVPEVNLPGLVVFIRKKGYKGNDWGDDFKNIEYFNYNQIPCENKVIEIIESSNPYK